MKLPRPRNPIRVAALLILLGLAVEASTLFGVHPLAFVAFIVGGGLLIVGGVLLYLVGLTLGWSGLDGT